MKIVFNGVGAANFGIYRLLKADGFNLKKSIFVDSKGILYKDRTDLRDLNDYKHELIDLSNPEQLQGDCGLGMEGADILIFLVFQVPMSLRKNGFQKWLMMR